MTVTAPDLLEAKVNPTKKRRLPDIRDLLLDGQTMSVKVGKAVTDAVLEESMEGASTFTLTVLDPDRDLLRSKLLDHQVDADVGALGFRLAQVDWNRPVLSLTFEDRDVSRLRGNESPLKARRGKITRAEFVLRMIREVRVHKIPVYIPELHKRQPIAKIQETPDQKKSRLHPKADKFPQGSVITVKHQRATTAQKHVIEAVLTQGVSQGASETVLIAAIMTITQESSASNLKCRIISTGATICGTFQQDPRYWPASRIVSQDAKAFFDSCIRAFANNPTKSMGAVIDTFQRSGRPELYDVWKDEATRTVGIWLGSGGKSGSETRRGSYEFTRGQAGKPESSWDAIQRLAQEVNWRAFMRRGVLYYVSDKLLMGRRAALAITPESQGVVDTPFRYDRGKRVQQVTLKMFADYWTGLPGDKVTVGGLGPANGDYLVATARRSLFSPQVEVTLKAPTRPLPEPAPAIVTQQTQTTEFDGVVSVDVVKDHPELKTKIGRIVNTILVKFPRLRITSTTSGNHVPGSYHYRGMAADLAADPSYMKKAAEWIAQNLTPYLSEGIHNPNLAVKDQKSVDGPSVYAAVWAGHKDHIHVAVDEGVTWPSTPKRKGGKPTAPGPATQPLSSPFDPLNPPHLGESLGPATPPDFQGGQ